MGERFFVWCNISMSPGDALTSNMKNWNIPGVFPIKCFLGIISWYNWWVYSFPCIWIPTFHLLVFCKITSTKVPNKLAWQQWSRSNPEWMFRVKSKACRLKQNLQRRIFTHRGGVMYRHDSPSLVFEHKPIHYSPSMCSKRNW